MSIDKRPFEVVHPFRVQTYDIDLAGIVSNIVYIRWLEELRLLFLEQVYTMNELFDDGLLALLRSTHIDYKRPIRLSDRVVGSIWLHELTRVRWCLAAEIRVNDAIASVSKQSGVFVSRSTMELVSVPQRLRERLAVGELLTEKAS